MFDVQRVRHVSADPERRGLEGVCCGHGILYSRFLDVTYPYRVDLSAGVPPDGVAFVVYVAVVVFAVAVVP